MSEENKAIVRRFENAAWNEADLKAVDELIDPNCVWHANPTGSATGVERLKQIIGRFQVGFPDLVWTTDQIIAEGDKVATRATWRGTHTGEFAGRAPTGKEVTVTETQIYRVANGKVVENWMNVDQLGMLQQLEAIPK